MRLPTKHGVLPASVMQAVDWAAKARETHVAAILADIVANPEAWQPLRGIVLQKLSDAVTPLIMAEVVEPEQVVGLHLSWRHLWGRIEPTGGAFCRCVYAVEVNMSFREAQVGQFTARGDLTIPKDPRGAWALLKV